MKHGSSNRRARSRGNGKRHPARGQNFESNGPDVKIRGTAQQVLERYLALARDATSAGDRVAAEAYFQHAEHYYRILNPDPGSGQPPVHDRGGRGGRYGPAHTGFGPPEQGEGDSDAEGRTPHSVAAPTPQPEPPAEVPVAEPPAAPRQRRPRTTADQAKPVDLGT